MKCICNIRRSSGIDWSSKTRFLGVPLVHIAAGRDEQGRLRVAKGWIAIGQFAIGAITIAQFGVGLLGLGQFMVGAIVVGQFALGSLVGIGQFSTGVVNVGLFPLPLSGIPAVLLGVAVLVLTVEIVRWALRPRAAASSL